MRSNNRKAGGAVLAALVALSGAGLAACGDSEEGAKSTTAGASAAERLEVAFLPGVTANPYFKVEIDAAKALAAKENVDLTVIDSQLDAQKQVQQLQDLTATGQYDGILIVPLNGAALVPGVRAALDAGIAVGAADVPIGPDPTTSETQVEGLAVFSGRPFSVHGDGMGKLTVEACQGVDPCNVAFMYGLKASTYDQALYEGYRDAIAAAPNVKFVAEAEGGYTREGGLKATQDLLQAHDDLDVLVSVDQQALGGEAAIKAAGRADDLRIIGFGGTRQAVAAVAAGRWYGDVVQTPVDEATLGLQGVIDAIRSGELTGYVDPVIEAGAPEGGLLTKDNADGFTAQYDG